MPAHHAHHPTTGRTHHRRISNARFTLSVALVLLVLFGLVFVIMFFAPAVGG